MNKKITDWLLKSDEEFLVKLKDEQSRKEFLGELHRKKVTFLALICITIVMTLFGITVSSGDSSSYIFFFLLVGQYAGYLDIESQIRSVRLYELSIATDNKFR